MYLSTQVQPWPYEPSLGPPNTINPFCTQVLRLSTKLAGPCLCHRGLSAHPLQQGRHLRPFTDGAAGIQLAGELGTADHVVALVADLAIGVARHQINH